MICNAESTMVVSDRAGMRRDIRLLGLVRYANAASRSQVELLALCLIALSLADLLTTYFLLRSYRECYEANPIAQYFFEHWNILGMTLFKFTLVAVVIAVCEIIERRRPCWGKLLMAFACLAAGAVVYQGLSIYSQMSYLAPYFG
jgi:Domain of unknown function (DUF5658)